jgi:hypothetical protein
VISAGVDSSYVYILKFLRALVTILEDVLERRELGEIRRLAQKLELSVKSTFSGEMGNTAERPISPLIWAPFIINTFDLYEADYNALESSAGGRAGWVSMWRKFHKLEEVRAVSSVPVAKTRIGLPALS